MRREEIEEDEIDLRELFLTIKNNRVTLFFITLFILFLTLIYLYYTEPVYSSSVTIALDNQEKSKIDNFLPEEVWGDIKNKERLQLAKVTLKSKKFINTLVDKVNVNREFFIKRDFKKTEVPEFYNIKIDVKYKDSNLYDKFFEIVPLDKDRFLLNIKKIKYSNIHKYNEKIENKLFSLRVIKTNKKNPFIGAIENKIIDFLGDDNILSKLIKPRYYFRLFDKDKQADLIIKNMNVTDLSDNILKIEYSDNMPIQAKEVVEEIAKSYIEYTLANKTSELEQTLEFLDRQIMEIKSNLKRKGDKLKKYQQKSGVAIMSEGENILKDIEKKKELIDKISLQIKEAKKFKDNLKVGLLTPVSLVSVGIDTSSIQSLMENYRLYSEKIEALRFQQNNIEKPVTSNAQINSLIDELKEKELSIQSLLESFTPEHPQVIEEESELDTIKNKIHSTIISNIKRLEKSRAIVKSTILNNIAMLEINLGNKLRLLKSNIREKKALLQTIPAKHMVNENLKRKFTLSGDIYTFLLKRKIEVEISKASIIANTKILENAYIAKKPIKPKKKLILAVSLIIGFILGLFYIFIREFFNTKIRTVKDIKKLTDIPIYGTLPLKSNKRFFEEALRNIRTNLQFILSEDKESINILISSTIPKEGKTIISAGLGDIISKAGKKVLLMDLDLRKPRLYRELKRSNKIGMSNYLIDNNIKITDVIQSINENLDFFPAGAVPPNPSELLMSKKFEQTIKKLEKKYDYIIFDSAPIGSVTDANMILKYADILLLVVKADIAEKVFLENFNQMVKDKKIKSSGIILNGVKLFKNKKYGYGYGYGYGDK